MPTQLVTPPAKPTGVSPVPPAAKPVSAFEVECTNVESLNTSVQLLEPTGEKNPDGSPVEALHACVRMVHQYTFVLKPNGPSHPQVAVNLNSLSPLPFVPRGKYILSLQEA